MGWQSMTSSTTPTVPGWFSGDSRSTTVFISAAADSVRQVVSVDTLGINFPANGFSRVEQKPQNARA
jgi:hypothetical protein